MDVAKAINGSTTKTHGKFAFTAEMLQLIMEPILHEQNHEKIYLNVCENKEPDHLQSSHILHSLSASLLSSHR